MKTVVRLGDKKTASEARRVGKPRRRRGRGKIELERHGIIVPGCPGRGQGRIVPDYGGKPDADAPLAGLLSIERR